MGPAETLLQKAERMTQLKLISTQTKNLKTLADISQRSLDPYHEESVL